MKKSVLVLTTFYKPFIGGAEVFTEEITRRLGEDFNFIIFTARHSRLLPKKEVINSAAVYRLGFGFRYDKFLFPFLALIKSYSADFNFSYAIMASYAAAAAFLIKVFRKKAYILSLQSGTLDMPEYKKIINFFYPFYKLIHTKASFAHVISNALKERAEKLGVPSGKIFHIPSGIDLNNFKILGIKRNYWQIIAVANFKKVKGLEYLLQAMPIIIKKFPDVRLALIGDGEERANLKNLVDILRLKNNVQFLGKINHEKLPHILNSSSIFIGPSLAEGLGIAFLEAMACGTVVVGTKVGGICDIIDNNYNGLLIEPSNYKNIANSVLYLLENKAVLESLRSNALKFVRKYNWDDISVSIKLLLEKM